LTSRPHEHQPNDGILTAIKPVLEIVVVAVFVVTFIVQPFRIPSESMEPTLLVGDFLLVDKQSFAPSATAGSALEFLDRLLPPTRIHRGDLVVFHDPLQPTETSTHLVKRIVGLPGDRLRLRDGRVFIDSLPIAEPYAFYSPTRPNNFRDDFPSLREADPNVEPRWWIHLRRSASTGELTVPPNQFFVLGDNRNDSEDSRYWGFVPRSAIIGRPLVVYFSLHPPNPSDPNDPPPTLLHRLRDVFRTGRHSLRILR
jgi:signal peptidase I